MDHQDHNTVPPLEGVSAQQAAPRVSKPSSVVTTLVWYQRCALAALAATVIWLLWLIAWRPAFWDLGLWSLFVVASMALVLMPMPKLRARFGLSERHAVRCAALGAGGMVFMWVAFLLPAINGNRAFFGTLATVMSVLAAWLVSERTPREGDDDTP